MTSITARHALVITLSAVFLGSAFTLYADWTAPLGAPPVCKAGDPGCDAPIHTGSSDQKKSGALTVNTSGKDVGFVVERGKVGIGTISPAGSSVGVKLHVAVDNGMLPSVLQGETGIILSNTSAPTNNANLNIISGNQGRAELYFGDTDSDRMGRVGYNHSINTMSFFTNGTEKVVINSNGNVGIGTNAPTSLLTVQGATVGDSFASRSTPTVGTFFSGNNFIIRSLNNDLYWTSADFYPNDDNTRSLGLITKRWSDLQVGTGNSSFGGNVGIGVTSPVTRFMVKDSGSTFISMGSMKENPFYSGITFSQGNVGAPVTQSNYSLLGEGIHTFINRPTGGSIFFRENNTDQVVIKNGGNVGIGTAGPTAKLEVVGKIRIRDGKPPAGSVLTADDDTGLASWKPASGGLATEKDTLGTVTDSSRDVSGGVGANVTTRAIGTNGLHSTGDVRIDGNVGIGVYTIPGVMLNVHGGIKITTASPANPSLVVERGGVDLPGAGSGVDLNVPYTRTVFNKTEGNTSYNFLSGKTILADDGNDNTGEYQANVGIGTKAPTVKLDVVGQIKASNGLLVTNGKVGIGTNTPDMSLEVRTPGLIRGKPSIGVSSVNAAGQPIWAYLMQNSRAEIVRSANTDLTFAHEVTKGVDSGFIRDMIIDSNGNVGIGTMTPTAKLQVAGQIKIVDGTQVDGYVLTSDGTGLASWQPANGGSGGGTLTSEKDTLQSVTERTKGNTTNQSVAIDTSGVAKESIVAPVPGVGLDVRGGAIKATGGFILETRSGTPTDVVSGRMWLDISVPPN